MQQLPPPLKSLFAWVTRNWLPLLLLFLVLVLLAGVVVFLIYRSRKKAAAAPAAGAAAQPAAPPAAPTGQLRAAWLRFLRRLPLAYRRSILNFEHFVVMGPAASGKSRLIDGYTDWRRQTKEFASSQPTDPDLPVYLASSEVVMEIPARVLEDHGDSVYRSLNRLWRPIYRERGPTVIAVFDIVRMNESTPDLVVDLAEKMRGKINVISAIRGRPIEVRVALTHLDEIEGYQEFAAFCRECEIPTHITIPAPAAAPAQGQGQAQAGAVDLPARIDTWFEEMRGHIPGALTSLHSPEYRKIITFLRKAPEMTSALKPFLTALFQHEALVLDPVFGGVYFSSDPPGVANPIYAARERGPGPDPQRRHAIASALFVGGCLALMGLAFEKQYSAWETADAAFVRYSPAQEGVEQEYQEQQKHRDDVCAFTSRQEHWLERHPDFFESPRNTMRKDFSERIRRYLVRRLTDVAQKGTLMENGLAMPARRAIFYLGLIHSDHADRLALLQAGKVETVKKMIELPWSGSLLEDYLANVDHAYAKPVEFDLPDAGRSEDDSSAKWRTFVNAHAQAMKDKVISLEELKELQKQSKELKPLLVRFEDQAMTRYVLHHLDLAAGAETKVVSGHRMPGELESHYERQFEGFTGATKWANDGDVVKSLGRILTMVEQTSLDVKAAHTLDELETQLQNPLGEVVPTGGGQNGPVLRIKVEDSSNETVVMTSEWEGVLRRSKAQQYVDAFNQAYMTRPEADIFFRPDVMRTLPPVVWNANGEMAVIFTGRGELRGPYTRSAYEKHVRDVVFAVNRGLEREGIDPALRQTLEECVKAHVRSYGQRYREELEHFISAFDVQARSVEELRVALDQMKREKLRVQRLRRRGRRELAAGRVRQRDAQADRGHDGGVRALAKGSGGRRRARARQVQVDPRAAPRRPRAPQGRGRRRGEGGAPREQGRRWQSRGQGRRGQGRQG